MRAKRLARRDACFTSPTRRIGFACVTAAHSRTSYGPEGPSAGFPCGTGRLTNSDVVGFALYILDRWMSSAAHSRAEKSPRRRRAPLPTDGAGICF
ncbi:hypothetical protein IF2G_09157 [Cordyceps javanica]|nr:hypothetical protein IF2G_09157 [Cordyceps javanica]